MRAVLQRVSRAAVSVDGATVGSLGGPGLLALVAVGHHDGEDQARWLADKIADLRVLRDGLSVAEAAAGVLLVSQFTLLADTRKGRRPSWSRAARGEQAEPLVSVLAGRLRERGVAVSEGVFGADMSVELVNDGPVTLVVDTP